MKIAVLGADNYIGRRIVAELKTSNWAESHALDARRSKSWPDTIRDCDGVVSCVVGGAGTITSSMRDLVAAMQAAGNASARLVNVSSMTVYGDAEGLVGEADPPKGALSEYASARLDAERCAGTHANVVTLRLGCEYGPHCPQWSERIARLLLARRLGDLGSAGDGFCNLVYIDDVARAVLKALRTPGIEGQVFNIAMPDPPTWNEYLIGFGKTLRAVPVRRVTRRRMKVETKLLAIPLKVGEIACQRVGIPALLPPAIPPSFLRLTRQAIRLDVTRAERVLGMQWTSLEEGLRATTSALGLSAAAH